MPSMSYCMFSNTVLEMKQIVAEMDEQEFDLKELDDDERLAYDMLVDLCREFLVKAGQ